jgi:hypothetical protein
MCPHSFAVDSDQAADRLARRFVLTPHRRAAFRLRRSAADGNGWDELAEMREPAWLYNGKTEILN